jgi:hypothetical protein
MKRSYSRIILPGALPLLILLGGCIAVGARPQAHVNPTLGQQLVDLQRARNTGALSEPEYESMRARLLNPPPPVILR